MPGSTSGSAIAAVGKSWAGAYAWPAIRKFIVTKPLGAVGGSVIFLMVLTAIFADVLAPYDPYEISQLLQFNPQACRTAWVQTNLAETCSHLWVILRHIIPNVMAP